ncbi:putative signal transduction protein with CBS domains [Kribbella flavida DSM 17836]|uniref:Putative signal transduction protein with CBS domains n=3 Tax=Kribbella flavida TaxID=182640 RepID=D2PVT0_KRIFD|nr:putative signal transduction protein with CBS domains [Kribbella flavida DSM 17836]
MHGEQMAEQFPVVGLDSDAREAVELLASRRLPGLIVVDEKGSPHSVLPASQVVRFLVPSYVQDDPSLARVIDESLADQVADKLAGVTVRKLLPSQPAELPVVKHDDTVLEVAAIMARLRCPLVAVVKNKEIIGAITASRLLELVVSPH